jgi:hypothetical protein
MNEGMTDEQFKAEVQKAESERNFPRLSALIGLPEDVLRGERILSRNERRQWYHENKKRLGLPEWRALETLKEK